MRRIIYPWLFGSAFLSATIIKHEWPANTSTKSGLEPYQFGQRVVKPWDNQWDGKHTKDAIDSNPSLPRQSYSKLLIFVRHGQYNLKAATRDEKVLTSLGWKQAYESGRQLKRSGIKIDRIVHSDLIRARQTTAAILAGLQDDCDHLFDYSLLTNLAAPEKSHLRGNYASSTSLQTGDTDSLSDDTTLSDHMIGQPYQPFSTSSFDCQQSRFLTEGPPPVGPEPPISTKMKPDERQTIGARLEQGFTVHIHRLPVTNRGQHARTADLFKISSLAHADSSNSTSQSSVPSPAKVEEGEDLTTPFETIVFVGHANVFRYWLCRALQLPPEAWLRISLYHGSISSLLVTYEPSVWTMAPQTHGHPPVVFSRCVVSSLRIGEIGHLPKELLSR